MRSPEEPESVLMMAGIDRVRTAQDQPIVDRFIPRLYFKVGELLREVAIPSNFNAVIAPGWNPSDRKMAVAIGPS